MIKNLDDANNLLEAHFAQTWTLVKQLPNYNANFNFYNTYDPPSPVDKILLTQIPFIIGQNHEILKVLKIFEHETKQREIEKEERERLDNIRNPQLAIYEVLQNINSKLNHLEDIATQINNLEKRISNLERQTENKGKAIVVYDNIAY